MPLKKRSDEQTAPVAYSGESQKQHVTHTEVFKMNQELQQVVTTKIEEMKKMQLSSQRAFQESTEQHQQQLQEYIKTLQQQLHESNERQQQQLQELQVAVEGVRQDNQQLREISIRSEEMEGTIQ